MNEEMRKEFEKWFSSYCDARGFNYSFATLLNGEYASWPEHNAFLGWQASREAMKPIEFPAEIELDLIGDQVAPTHQNSYAEGYNDALSDLELKITELGYKVEA